MRVSGERALLRLDIFYPDYFPKELCFSLPLITVHKSTPVTVDGQLLLMSDFRISAKGQKESLMVYPHISFHMTEGEYPPICSLAFPMSFSVPQTLMSSAFDFSYCCLVFLKLTWALICINHQYRIFPPVHYQKLIKLCMSRLPWESSANPIILYACIWGLEEDT